MSNYSRMVDELAAKIAAKNKDQARSSCSYSKSDLESLTLGLLNDPGHTVTEYQMHTETDGSPVTVEKAPSLRYRESLKPMLKSLGLDKNDVEKVNDVQFTKEHASALMGVATTAIKDYLKAGRKMTLPITAPDESRMEMYCAQAPERVNTNRFAKTEEEKAKTSTTMARRILKSKNATPSWLKKTV